MLWPIMPLSPHSFLDSAGILLAPKIPVNVV
jgi:hypothetical protein